jgi:hypothetical protein
MGMHCPANHNEVLESTPPLIIGGIVLRCWACSCWYVSGPHANVCPGAACCALAVGPAAAGASGPNAGTAFVALWLLGLQLLVRVWSSSC